MDQECEEERASQIVKKSQDRRIVNLIQSTVMLLLIILTLLEQCHEMLKQHSALNEELLTHGIAKFSFQFLS